MLYNKKSVDKWSGFRSLIDAANNFIAANLADLTASQNMPGGFQASFQANGYQHQSIYKHAIYANVIEKLKDGQQLFIDDAAIKKQFTFSKLIAVNMDEGSASLRGRIVNNFNLPVQRASIIPADQKYFAITDAKGNVVSTVLPKAPIYLLLHAC